MDHGHYLFLESWIIIYTFVEIRHVLNWKNYFLFHVYFDESPLEKVTFDLVIRVIPQEDYKFTPLQQGWRKYVLSSAIGESFRREVSTRPVVSLNLSRDIAWRDNFTMCFRLKVTYILSQPQDTWTGRRGLISQELLEELVGKNNFEGCVFTCGPPLFMQAARK